MSRAPAEPHRGPSEQTGSSATRTGSLGPHAATAGDARGLALHVVRRVETGGAYAVKRYKSEKSASGEGGWQHERIMLEPLNKDYRPIVLTPQAEGEVTVVAEFVRVVR